MRARLGFSIATAVDPDILILDEVLSVGDAKFKKKSLAKVRSMFDKGVTVLFVSHNIDQVKEICNKAILLEHGTIIAAGDAEKVAAIYEEKTTKPKSKKAKAVVVPLTDKEKKEEKKAVADAEAAYERIKHYEDEVVVKMSETDEAERRYDIYLNMKSAYMSEKLSKDDFIKEVDHLLEMDLQSETSSYETPHVNKLEERLKKIEK